jgi:hypothetical protein
MLEIVEGLRRYCEERGISRITEIIGSLIT